MLATWSRFLRTAFSMSRATIGVAIVLIPTSGLSASLPLAVTGGEPEPQFSLEWQSPSSCPQEAEVQEQIRAMLDVAPNSALPSRLRAKGVIEPVESRYQLTLSVQIGEISGSRVISSIGCRSLGKAAAVVLGLLIRKERDLGRELSDSDLGSGFQQSDGAPETGQGQAKPVEPRVIKPRDETLKHEKTPEASTPRKRWLLFRAPTATVDFWTLPQLDLGFGLSAGVRLESWRLFATLGLWKSQSRTAHAEDSYQTTFNRTSVEAWACRSRKNGVWEVSPCGLISLDFVNASASGDQFTTESQRVALVSAGGGLSGYLHLSSTVALFLSATGRVWLRRPTFVVQAMRDTESVHTVPVATVLSSVGAEWNF
jgi:hypothetical protein